jgi:ATP-dependent DNA helicase RecG
MENQNIEYKETWRDEYIKWICGFANAFGGKIYIGIDDKGNISGINDAKKILEEIPNKTKDLLGILVDVNLKTKSKKHYLEIVVESYPYPVSYKGQYHFRSGSTKQELKGAALDKFILQKLGKHWDTVPQPNLKISELSKNAFDYFKEKSADSKRISSELLKVSHAVLLEKLHLTTDIGYYKRATILLFHGDPEKYITGSFIKIGFFISDDDLVFQDEIHGNLFEQVEKTMDLLLTKYLKANILYKGINRIELYPIPETALREALLNAVVHKNYANSNPIQISVYSNKLIIWNEGELPDNWTVDRLKTKHPSKPFNPDLANGFFRAGLIEAWGRGTLKILNECRLAKTSLPVFKYDLSGFVVEFDFSNKNIKEEILTLIKENKNITVDELCLRLDTSKSTIQRHIKKMKEENKLLRNGADKAGYWEVLQE